MIRKCVSCGDTFDPIEDYTYMHDIGDDYASLEDFFPDISDRTLCEKCCLDYLYEVVPAGEAYSFSLETGHAPSEYFSA